MLAPFLEEVGIPARLIQYACDRLGGEVNPLLMRGSEDGQLCFVWREGTDHGEFKETLGVGLCIASETAQLRQTGTDHRNGEGGLGTAVESADESRKLVLLDVLDLIDEEDNGSLCSLGGLPDLFEEDSEVAFEVAVVSQTCLWLHVDADLYVVIFELEDFSEAGEGAEPPGGEVFCQLDAA